MTFYREEISFIITKESTNLVTNPTP